MVSCTSGVRRGAVQGPRAIPGQYVLEVRYDLEPAWNFGGDFDDPERAVQLLLEVDFHRGLRWLAGDRRGWLIVLPDCHPAEELLHCWATVWDLLKRRPVRFITYRKCDPSVSRLPQAQVFDVASGGLRIVNVEDVDVLAEELTASTV